MSRIYKLILLGVFSVILFSQAYAVELLTDAVDSGRCVAEFVTHGLSYDSPVSGFVCTLIHVASAYDVASLAGAVGSAGTALLPAEAVDVGLSSLKVVVKSAAQPLSEGVLKAATSTINSSPGLIVTMAAFVAKRGDDAVESSRSFIKLLGLGKGAEEATLKMLDDFGDLPIRKIESLGSSIKGLGAETWAQTEKEGLHKIIKNFPESSSADGAKLLPPSADSVLIGINRSQDIGEQKLKQIVKYSQENSGNLAFEKVIPSSPTGQNADLWAKIDNKEYWIEATQLEEKVTSTVPIGEHILTKAEKFKFAINQDNTINIKLLNGTTLSKQFIENQILYEFSTNPSIMKNITRVQVYDAVADELIEVKYWS